VTAAGAGDPGGAPGAAPPGAIARGIAWVSLAASLVAVFDIVALALILRLWVSPQELGAISVVVTLFGALQLAAELGLPAALVQRGPDRGDARADAARLSTIYWLGIAAGLMQYALVWIAGPLVARAYGEPVIGTMFRVVGIVLVIRPLYTTHQALLRRALRFKEMSIVRMVANTLELVSKLGSALAGAGVWCFAIGPLVREATYAVGVPLRARWRPEWICRPRQVAADLRFGVRATGGELLFQIYSTLDYQIIAYTYGTAAVGLYRAAKELVLEPVRFVSGVITVVAFPAFARLRGDRPALVAQYLALCRQNLVVVLALLTIAVIAAEELIAVILGAAYAPAADAARVLAGVGVLRALSHLGPPLLDGVGRPDLSLRYHAVAAATLTAAFAIAAAVSETFFGVAIAWAAGYPIAFAWLTALVLRQLALPLAAYLRSLAAVARWLALAAAIGALVHAAAADLGAGARLAVTAGASLAAGLGLLAVREGISPRAVARALRG
jgi:teichuronic acid exporter